MADTIVLKRYANRRLYDTELSRYVTLNAVADRIRSGRRVQVVDAKTQEDVTAFILTQILVEEAKKKNVLLPPDLLHMIIQYGDNVLLEFFEKYLRQILHSYLSYKRSTDDQFKRWLAMGADLSETARENFSRANPLASAFEPFFKAPGTGKKQPK